MKRVDRDNRKSPQVAATLLQASKSLLLAFLLANLTACCSVRHSECDSSNCQSCQNGLAARVPSNLEHPISLPRPQNLLPKVRNFVRPKFLSDHEQVAESIVSEPTVPDEAEPQPRFVRFHPVPTGDVFRPTVRSAATTQANLPPNGRATVQPIVPLDASQATYEAR